MSKYDIYWINFKYEDSDEIKRRPVLQLSENKIVELAKITSHSPRTESDYQLRDWKEAGLSKPSTIRLDKTMLINSAMLTDKIGSLSNYDIKKVEQLLNKKENLTEAKRSDYTIYYVQNLSSMTRGEEQDKFFTETITTDSAVEAFKAAVAIKLGYEANEFDQAIIDYGYDIDEIREFNPVAFLDNQDPTGGDEFIIYGIKKDDRLIYDFDFDDYEELKYDLESDLDAEDDIDDEENELEDEDIMEYLPKTIEQGFCSGIQSVENGFYDWTLLINDNRIYVNTRPDDKVFKEIAHSIKNTGKLEGTLKSGDDWRIELIFNANNSLTEAYTAEDEEPKLNYIKIAFYQKNGSEADSILNNNLNKPFKTIDELNRVLVKANKVYHIDPIIDRAYSDIYFDNYITYKENIYKFNYGMTEIGGSDDSVKLDNNYEKIILDAFIEFFNEFDPDIINNPYISLA